MGTMANAQPRLFYTSAAELDDHALTVGRGEFGRRIRPGADPSWGRP